MENMNENDLTTNASKEAQNPLFRVGDVMPSFWCRIGLHDWYKGNFSSPVWARYERHCLECDKKQYSEYKDKKQYWVDF